MIKKIIKEPLFHFLCLGGLIFFISELWRGDTQSTEQIVVSEGKIKHISNLFEKTWQRKPSSQELKDVVQEYVLEQAAYREGVRLGLDKNDIVIVRRVHQKVDFIAEKNTTLPYATDDLLAAYLKDNADKFRLENRLSLKQVYFDPKKHGNNIQDNLTSTLATLIKKPKKNINELGERYLFKPSYPNKRLSELNNIFGNKFVNAIENLPENTWQGPVLSGFGMHLVYIEDKQVGELPTLDQIHSKVLREWQNSLREQSHKQYYDELLKRYPAVIHWPEQKTP